ncbi:hypothetical protein BMS3Abin14_00787 [bacterium BMS3Abin14]|nr:hypothetical protein BMS3Abin14_00787 [bacterium BMS3Abin14]
MHTFVYTLIARISTNLTLGLITLRPFRTGGRKGL